MKRWPFAIAGCTLFIFNILRLGSNSTLRVWNDPICAIFFVGYLICCALTCAVTTHAPPVE